jgi:HEAT repeat protein
MPINVECPGCARKLKAKEDLAGKRVKCPSCGQVIVVPAARPASYPKATSPSAVNPSAAAAGAPMVAPSRVPASRPLRWPWYAGGGAVAVLCLVAGVVFFAMSGKDRTASKDAAVKSEPVAGVNPDEKSEQPPHEKEVASGDRKKAAGRTGSEPSSATGKSSSGNESVDQLIQVLSDKADTARQRQAASKLKELGPVAAPAVPTLIRSLSVTQTIEFPYPVLGDPTAKIAALRPVLLGPCCEALVSVGAPSRDPIAAGLSDKDVWVRYGCAWVAGRLGDKSLVPVLQERASTEEDDRVKTQVAESLALLASYKSALNTAGAIQDLNTRRVAYRTLLALLVTVDKDSAKKVCLDLGGESQPAQLQDIAAEIASMFDDAETAKMLIRLTKHPAGVPGAVVDWHACRSLGIRREQAAKTALADLALKNSTNDGTRVQAAWALARIGDDRGKEVLRKVAASTSFAKSQAEEAIANLEKNKAIGSPPTPPDPKGFEPRFEHIGNGLHTMVE